LALFERVQRTRAPRGRYGKSPRLLARLGVLRCGSCGTRMSLSAKEQGKRPFYRCTGDCQARATVSASMVEGLVVRRVRELLWGLTGTASAASGVRTAKEGWEGAEAELKAVVDALTAAGLASDLSAAERLSQLKAARDEAKAAYDKALAADGATRVAVTVADWDVLTLDEQRGLIQAVIEAVEVRRGGRGPERVTIRPRL
jgi:hypothetical protein